MDTLQENPSGTADENIHKTKEETLFKRVSLKVLSTVAFVIIVVIVVCIILTLGLSSSHPG